MDDPSTFGAIAAANALSDVYAMGARPIVALAIAAFPEDLPPHITQAILQGGADKVAEAGAVVAGGHTVMDKEPKYGLCVTGLIDPTQVTAKAHAQPGDVLLLNKPLGTGIITTAIKPNVGDDAHLAAAVASMLQLNNRASELAQTVAVHSVTDITGYGLLGHGSELARNSGVGLRIDVHALPALLGALQYAGDGVVPGGLHRNREYVECDGYVHYERQIDAAHTALLFDPQTSGGLLIVLPPADADALQARYTEAGQGCWRIGEVIDGDVIKII